MKKIIFPLLGILIVSNVIWSYLYIENIEKVSKAGVQYYNLNGTGEMWSITDYKIIVSPSKIFRGHGKLAYKGDPTNIEYSTYYRYEIKEIDPYGDHEIVYIHEASSNAGPVAILINLNDLGSITSDYTYDELKKDKQNYESTTLTITWNDNNGELHSETINLDIDSEITINNK